MSQVEVDDTPTMHFTDRRFEFSQKIRRQLPGERSRKQDARSVLEDERICIEPTEHSRNGGNAGEPPVGLFLPEDQSRRQKAPDPSAPRCKVLHDDVTARSLDEQDIWIAPAAAVQHLASSIDQLDA